uniref:Uncharacterized protein n=1 Tax=Arundo donax TaxID=35708 RepID=A0A0A9HJN9_ARUDO
MQDRVQPVPLPSKTCNLQASR